MKNFAAALLAVATFFTVVIGLSIQDRREWERFKSENNCVPMEFENETVLPDAQIGKPYLCDGGIYWR